MLQHRLPFVSDAACTAASVTVPDDVASIPRVNLRAASAVMIAYDVLCAIVFLVAIQADTVAPKELGPAPALLVWFSLTVALGAWSARATGLYAKQTLMKQKGLPALAVLAATASFLPCLLSVVAFAAFDHAGVLQPLLCAAAAILSIAAGHVCWRLCLDRMLERGYCLDRVVVLAETAAEARIFAASLERRSAGRLRAMTSLAIRDAAVGDRFSWLQKVVRLAEADQIIIAEAVEPRPSERRLVFQLVRGGADVTVVPRFSPAYRVSATPSLSPDLPEMHEPAPPLGTLEAGLKRAFDVVAAVLALVTVAPICLLIALAIKLDSRGPVFFRQTRHGAKGAVFRIVKFRTMTADAAYRDDTLQTQRNDPRVTAVGRLLRRTSLDELPQLFNVLSGEMSIVGPRPHAVGMLIAGTLPHRLLPAYGLRHRVKPGITGWAQIHGSRGEIGSSRALRRRFALDRHYIENWSLRMDVMIILRTLALPFIDEHAF